MIVSRADFVVPVSVAVIVADVLTVTLPVLIVKVPVVLPAEIANAVGTVASD